MMDMTIVWLGLFVVLLLIEIISLGLTTIWFAGGSLIAAVTAVLGGPVWLQAILFLVVSGALLLFTRPIAVKYFNKDRAKTNVEGMIGKQAIVISEVNNAQGIGQVTVDGMEWSARTEEEGIPLPVGSVVTVTKVIGVKLIVKEKS